jgi:hypothetical protein
VKRYPGLIRDALTLAALVAVWVAFLILTP